MVIDKKRGKPTIIMDDGVFIVEWEETCWDKYVEIDMFTGKPFTSTEMFGADLVLAHNAFNTFTVKKSSILPTGMRVKLSKKQLGEYEKIAKSRASKVSALLDRMNY